MFFFLFVPAVISLLVTNLALYLLCKHKKCRTLVASLASQQIKEAGAVTTLEEVTTESKIQIYIILALTVSLFSLVMFAVLHSRRLKLCRGCMFSNAVKSMLFVSSVWYYVPIKLCKMAGKHWLIQNYRYAKTAKCKLNWNYIWDTIEIDWKEVNVTLNSNKINLPKFVTIKLRDKFKIRCMMKREPLLFHIMLRQGFTWFSLASNTQETVSQPRYFSKMNLNIRAQCDFVFYNFHCALPEDMIDIEITIQMVDGIHSYRRDRTT